MRLVEGARRNTVNETEGWHDCSHGLPTGPKPINLRSTKGLIARGNTLVSESFPRRGIA